MKAVLISIQPKWCKLIASGKKTVEMRKPKPKIKVPYKVYIYETQGRTETPFVDEEGHHIFKGRGQVIGEFVCDRIVWGGDYVYGLHISDLVIYDKPRELSDFIKPCNTHFQCDTCKAFDELFGCGRTIQIPPRPWCYAEVQE